ncbi:MAG TPA: hypothetical protein PKH39_17825, partial [Woeseiaceae bacterium]|nr:hypothetical protein [Woeseiaceae bacterium]
MATRKSEQVDEPVVLATKDGVCVRPVLEVLSKLRGGNVLDLLSIELNEVVNAIKASESGKGGAVTLTLKINRVKKIPDALEIIAEISGKAPQYPPRSDLMFYDDDGNLHTRNPNQGDIFDNLPRGV